MSVVVEPDNTIYDSRNNCNAIIETASNTLIAGCNNTTIPSSVTTIGDYAFYCCKNLTSVTIPNSVTSIGDNTFWHCDNLTNITIPNSVTNIGEGIFGCCSSLMSIVVESSNTIYDSRNDCNAIIETASNTLIAGCMSTIIPNSVTNIGTSAFHGCFELTSIEIPISVTSIGGSAFSSCTSLTSVTVPDGVISIGNSAFNSCSGLTSVTIPNSVTSIGVYAFSHCTSLTSVIFNAEDCETMGSSSYPVFEDCTSLSSVTIGENVKHIPSYAFNGNSNISAITCKAKTPPTCGTDVFKSVKVESVQLTVPKESVSLYQTADTWLDFCNITGAEFSGIEEKLVDDNENTTAVYYNLQGVRVENPERGLYIKRQGGKTSKVIL